jgi:type IV pilus assembly protein PilW
MPLTILRNTRAFTLIEVMVAIAVGMIVIAAVTTTFMAQTKHYSGQEQINEMEQNARGALDLVLRELEMAGYDPNAASFNGVTYNTSQLMIQSDLDGNGTISTSSTANEQITYAYNSATMQITRIVGTGSAQVLADNISAFNFIYLDANGAATTTSANIRQVSITITARTARSDPNYASNGGYRTYTMTATTAPPNLAL